LGDDADPDAAADQDAGTDNEASNNPDNNQE